MAEGKSIEDIHTIPFEKSNGLMLVDAVVDGVSGKLIFDTGSDAVVLNSYAQGHDTSFETLSGGFKASDIEITSIQIGSYSLTNFDGYASDLSHLLKPYGEEILGIFGASALVAEIIHIDNINNVIELYPNRYINSVASGSYRKTDLVSIAGLPAVQVKIEGIVYTFLLDTGCTISIIDQAVRRRHARYFEQTEVVRPIQTAHNKAKLSKHYQAQALFLDQVNIKGLTFASQRLPKLNGHKLAGILSIDQLPFDELLIDWSNKQIYFKI